MENKIRKPISAGSNTKIIWSKAGETGDIADWTIPSGLTLTKQSDGSLLISKPNGSPATYNLLYNKLLETDYKGMIILGSGQKTSSWYITFNLYCGSTSIKSQIFSAGSSEQILYDQQVTLPGSSQIKIVIGSQNDYTSSNSGVIYINEIILFK